MGVLARIVLLVALLVGCGHAIEVRSPSVAGPWTIGAQWVVTQPALPSGVRHVSAGRDATYAIGCDDGLVLTRISRGGHVDWSRRIGPNCFNEGYEYSIAATRAGVIVGFIGVDRAARVMLVNSQGKTQWEQALGEDTRTVHVASFRDKHAVCASRVGGTRVYMIDNSGQVAAQHEIDNLYDDKAQCVAEYPASAWITFSLTASTTITVDGVQRYLGVGGWALRFGGGEPAFVQLHHRGSSTWTTWTRVGWVVYTYGEGLSFVDRAGATRWQLAFPQTGCSLQPNVLAASDAHLLASVHVFCGERGGTTMFGDVAMTDRTAREDDLGERDLIIDLDTKTMRARSIAAIDAPYDAHYVLARDGILVYGAFEDRLGLGTGLRSRPAEYECLSTLPRDAKSWSRYQTRTPSCGSGFALKTWHPAWPYLASLPRLPSL